MALGSAACPLPGWARPLVEYYVSNDLFALAVDLVVALSVLVVTELLTAPVLRRAPRLVGHGQLALRLLRGLFAATLVIIHEYVKEGYFFKPSDLGWPPRSHESFTVLVAFLSIAVRAPLAVRTG